MKKTAVVLAGGGSRGAYQIGVWKAMRELGIEYQLVTGTSVGALNGAMMVQGDYEIALKTWESLSSEDVVGDMLQDKGNLSDRQLTRIFAREALAKGGADISALEKFVYSLIDEPRFRQSEVDFALVTVEYPMLKPVELVKKDIPEGMLGEYLLASAACFPAFQVKEIEGHKYIDGGYHDNMPVNLAIKMGAQQIIAVDLESVGVSRRIKKGAQVTLIHSLWPLGSFLKFEGELAVRNIQLGYLDAMKAFGKYNGQLYTFYQEGMSEVLADLRNQAEQFLQQTKRREPKLTATLQSVVLRRMMREFRKHSPRLQEKQAFTDDRQLMMAAEYLGRILEIEPTKAYSFGEFLRLLKQTAQTCREQPVETSWFESGKLPDLETLGEELKKLDKVFLVLLIHKRLVRFLEGGGNIGEFLAISTFWKELVAAVLLYLTEQMEIESL